MRRQLRQKCIYVLADFISANAAWMAFNVIRYHMLEAAYLKHNSLSTFLQNPQVELGQMLIPLMMIGIFYLSGYYNTPFFKSRIEEAVNTIVTTFIGMLMIFFVTLINDNIPERLQNYELMAILWGLLSVMTYIPRSVITTSAGRRIRNGHETFNTLIIGTSDKAAALARRMMKDTHRGMKISGFVHTGNVPPSPLIGSISPNIVQLENLQQACTEMNISNLVIAPSARGTHSTMEIINTLFPLNRTIYITPDFHQVITSRPRMSDVCGEPLIDISSSSMAAYTANLKRIGDIAVSGLCLIALSPLMIAIAVAVKLSSPGPAIYSQERIGYHKKPFKIFKFRSMVTGAEPSGPALSSPNDSRITRTGQFLRKYRLDELPQFWNVLRGDMSLVGPRPERAFYVSQIIERAPYYSLVHQVRPGITSWGIVKFGYASSVDEMIERLRYDLIYIENVSFLVDLRILFHTIDTIFRGRGI